MELEITKSGGYGRATLQTGSSVHFGLHRSTLEQTPARMWSQDELAAAGRQHCSCVAIVVRKASGLRRPVGGSRAPKRSCVAGPVLPAERCDRRVATTSLPEGIGGERNWDYRYSWVRDASCTMEALWVAACPDEAEEFFAFMATAAASGIGPDQGLRIMFGIGGEHDLTERELPHLEGWPNSRPVRVGNGAWSQQQIEVYGELLGAAHRLADQIGTIDNDTTTFLIACADTAAIRWREKNPGIWEVRGDSQHFLYSKVMCWVALDRAHPRRLTRRRRPG